MNVNVSKNRTSVRLLGSIVGRTLVSLSRLLVALLIIRLTSPSLYGGYVVLMSLIIVAEWLVDFGYSDITVRELSTSSQTRKSLIGNLICIKAGLALLSFLLIIAVATLAKLPIDFTALSIGLISIAFYAFTLIHRSLHRVEMTTHIDVFFEAISLVIMMALIWWSGSNTNLMQLMIFQCVSRVLYFIFNCVYFWRSAGFNISQPTWINIKQLSLQSAPIGVAGLLVIFYDNMAPLILAKVITLDALAIYTVALRFLLPIAIITQAISAIFFTLLAERWENRAYFTQTQQAFVETSCLISGIIFCGVFSSAEFCMSLFGASMTPHYEILQLASAALFAKAITITMSPPIVLANKQHKTLVLTLWIVLLSAGLFYWIAPIHGLLGVAGTYVFIEVCLTSIPLIFLSQYMANFKLNWWPIVKLLICAASAVLLLKAFGSSAGLLQGIASSLLFLIFCMVLGVMSKPKLLQLQSILTAKKSINNEYETH